jgi:serine/threonine-protein kinase
MGVVFKVRDPLIGRLVALKTIALAATQSQDLRERFYREAQAAGGLQHPNIVTVYEMGEEAGVPFIAMEYLEGESLDAVLIGRTFRRSRKRRQGSPGAFDKTVWR